MDGFMRALVSVWTDSGFAALTIENIIMILVGIVLLYLAIAKEYEPLLLMPIAFGDIMANFPNTGFETDMGVEPAFIASSCARLTPSFVLYSFTMFRASSLSVTGMSVLK